MYTVHCTTNTIKFLYFNNGDQYISFAAGGRGNAVIQNHVIKLTDSSAAASLGVVEDIPAIAWNGYIRYVLLAIYVA